MTQKQTTEQNYWKQYLRIVQPTYMENWYEKLKGLTIPSKYFRVPMAEIDPIITLADGIDKISDTFNERLNETIEAVKKAYSCDKVFVRLGSRSPKDNMRDIDCVRSAKDVFTQFCDSERVLSDLMLAMKNGYEPYIFVRKWVEMKRSMEFRCFVKDNKLKGISQYFYEERHAILDDDNIRNLIENQAIILASIITGHGLFKNFVFDFHCDPKEKYGLLIEINPWSSWTDPALFDFATDKFERYEFRWTKEL